MKHWLGCFLFFYCTFIYACNVIDDAQNRIELKQPATRIISLAPDITENLFAIGAGKQIVGVIDGSDYPLAAKVIPSIGSYSALDLERIIALHPDLIITWGHNFSRQLSALKKLGIPVYVTDAKQLADIPRTFKNFGCLTNHERAANKLAETFSQTILQLKTHYQQQTRLNVFYQIGSYSLFTVNKESWINQVIDLCGGMNVFANARSPSPEISWEAAISANPQIVINSNLHSNWKKSWEKWPQVSAVKHKLLFTIHPDLLERASPRLLIGAKEMCTDFEMARKAH